MHKLLNKSSSIFSAVHRQLLHTKSIKYSFSTMPQNMYIQKAVEYQFKFRCFVKLNQLHDYIVQNSQDIKKYGKTILLEFLNQYPMQSFRRARDQTDIQKKQIKYQNRNKLYGFLNQLEDLNFYQQNMRYSIYKKLLTYIGQDQTISEKAQQYQTELINQLKNQNIHISYVINWLYMLPQGYTQQMSSLAFDIIQRNFQNPEVRYYMKSQRSLPALIKRIVQTDWAQLRKYKNIVRFLCYEASIKEQESVEQTVISLERVVQLKLHLVGQKVIPKMVDELFNKFDNEFEMLTKNKQSLMKVFSTFKHLPLNYNLTFFNKIHNYIKGVRQLSSHLILYLPYNKLNQSQVSFLQGKMFASGRQDIAPKLIYTIYEPQYKQILTPFLIKQAYSNMMYMWKKQNSKTDVYFQIYIALIFRFSKLNNQMIDNSKLRNIFNKLAVKMQEEKYELFNRLSVPGCISFFQLCQLYDVKINQNFAAGRVQNVLKSRRQKQASSIYIQMLLSGIKVHYNATHKRSRYFLTYFINEVTNHPESSVSQKLQLLFLIQKTLRPQPKWAQYSSQLSKQIIQDIDAFVEIYIKFESKTLKLTNFVFTKLYQRKAQFSSVLQLISSLNLKLLTSLKGKLISPLKKYIKELNLTQFDLSKSGLNTLVQAYRVLFYFRNQIPQFLQFYSIKLIEIIEQKCKMGEYVNGKQFASLSTYIMQVIANVDISQKTQIIQSIVSIIKTLRKKQGIYIKVYELDFLCNNQKYIKINNEVLQHHWNEIVETLKKTDRYDHHKDLYFFAIKLHCRQFVQLNEYDLRYFIDKCTQLIDDSSLNLTQIKQCLGYDILNCDNEFMVQKMKIFLSGMVKLAFRKDKRKHNYFMYEYYLKFFSRIQSTQMITQICQKLLYEKLYPVQVSNIVPILNKNQIKNKKFIKRILQIMLLSDAYVSYQKMQVMSWLEKILYQLPQNDFTLNSLKNKVNQEIIQRVSTLKNNLKNTLQNQQRSVEEGFQVEDPNFDQNYKIFIQYVWSSIKSKNIDSTQFKFVCRYLFFSLDKIKARIENPQERKQLSKIKLYHVLKYLKQCGFFQVNQQKLDKAVRQKPALKQKVRKNRLLKKMEKDLNIMKIQPCQKLQKRLQKLQSIKYQTKIQVQSKNPKTPVLAQYFITENDQGNKLLIKNKFIIHTVKKYHCTRQINILEKLNTNNKQKYVQPKIKEQIKVEIKEQMDVLDAGCIQNELEENQNQIIALDYDTGNTNIKDYINLEQSELSLDMKPQKLFFQQKQKQIKQVKVAKPLFTGLGKKKTQEKLLNQIKRFRTIIPLQKSTQDLYKDYNGYLRLQTSLFELTTGLKCIIYDPQRDIFFD